MYEKIPSELKEKTQWVNVWNSSKVPMQTGQKKAASSVLPDTWGTFDCAVLNRTASMTASDMCSMTMD